MKLINVLPIVQEYASSVTYQLFSGVEHLYVGFKGGNLYLTSPPKGSLYEAVCCVDDLLILGGEPGKMFGEFNGVLSLIEEYIDNDKSNS